MDKFIILGIIILVLIVVLIIMLVINGKNRINNALIPIDYSQEQINKLLKSKYKLFKEITTYIKDNLSIKEDAFKKFLDYNSKECTTLELIKLLDNTTYEINEYVDNYDELLKQEDFLKLKKELYNIQIDLEATIDYYNSKLSNYNNLNTHGYTKLSTKFFSFDEYNEITIERKEITRLINLT